MSLYPYQEQMETASKTSKATTQENKPKKKPTQPILATSLYLTFLSHQPQECKS